MCLKPTYTMNRSYDQDVKLNTYYLFKNETTVKISIDICV